MIALLVFVVASLACTKTERNIEAQVDALVAAELTDEGPGLAVAVISRGSVVLKKAYGFADIAERRRITASSVFDLASVSKQLTGAAVLLLAERGQLSLDDDVRKYVPEVPRFDERQPIRVRDLARHTSGLPEHKHTSMAPTKPTEILAWLERQPALADPTRRFAYTNLNYFLLARVIERASNKSWGAFLRDELFTPTGMTTAQAQEDPATPISGRTTGYCEKEHKPCRWDTFDTGAANVFASLDDMIAWDAAWRQQALPTQALLRETRDMRYAFGWFRATINGREVLMHDGDWLGASTYIARHLDDDLTVIILSNQAGIPVAELGRRIAALYRP